MGNFRKTLWTCILFVALLAPFVLVLILSLHTHISPERLLAAQQVAASQQVEATNRLIISAPSPQPDVLSEPSLLAASDGKTLWVAHPIGDHEAKNHSYELLQRESNTGMWLQAQGDRGGNFGGFPKGLTVVGTGAVPHTAADAYLFTDGSITRFSLMEHALQQALPAGQTLVAEAGGTREMFALTFGKPEKAAADRESIVVPVPDSLADDVTATTHAASMAATTPATQTMPAEIAASNNIYWFHDRQWFDLPSMDEGGKGGPENLMEPGRSSTTALVAHGGWLIALWINPASRNQLVARSIEYGSEHAVWSEAVVSELPEKIPESSRLLAATLDKSVFLLWPVFTSKTVSLHGGWLVGTDVSKAEMSLVAKNFLRPMNLGPFVTGQNASDVAVGAAENSFAVLVTGENGALTCQLFDDRGEPTGKAAPVEPKSPQHDMLLAENIGMVLLVMMVALSIWQWRQRPSAMSLPTHTVLAPLYLRGIAFLIDLAIPAVIATIIFGMTDVGMLFSVWTGSLTAPDELLKTPQLLYTIVFYVLHVTVGELFFRRSIGKSIVGLQVLMLDGKAPTVVAVVLRNLVRIPEMLPGILGFYVLMSETRQRFGDFLAQTMVVMQQSPETPEDPDAGEKAEKKDELVSAGRSDRSE